VLPTRTPLSNQLRNPRHQPQGNPHHLRTLPSPTSHNRYGNSYSSGVNRPPAALTPHAAGKPRRTDARGGGGYAPTHPRPLAAPSPSRPPPPPLPLPCPRCACPADALQWP